ncbi:hypothetical protein [uncultured Ruegeria sp.]|uniref:hypothetical protein n=1 Tax=uncultured Ruegeria sp. TaxID=259304 RepID=UPI0026026D2E|nr:hypothetical protein [uncultured Ruegeria sp.]
MKGLLPILGVCGLCACGDQLYVAHDTVVGVNAAVSANRQQGQVVIGFDRDFAALVPVIEPGGTGSDGNPRTNREAMAVFGCTRMETKSIFLTRYSDVISTGEAANKLAAKLGSGKKTSGAARLATCGEDENGNGNGNQSAGEIDNG